MTPDKIIKLVLAKGGSASGIAARIGGDVTRQNVEHWLKTGKFPEKHCPALEREYGIRCERLRPDLRWVRVPDADWANGKPLLDVAAQAA